MTNFIFKRPRSLIKNSPINVGLLNNQIKIMMREQRLQRQDLQDLKRMINKILIEKHLQMEVDDYFTNQAKHVSESRDLD